MLSKETNDQLTRVGPGEPMGELLRRYWQPAALAEELPPGGAPLPIRLLGEDLVLFRDEQAQPGLLGLHCSHRGADLSYGRIEDGGLRCIYHGWLYDIHGHCLEQPGEPAPAFRWTDSGGRDVLGSAAFTAQPEASDWASRPDDGSQFRAPESVQRNAGHEKIRHKAYPCVEMGGLILAYMGPGEPPLVPAYPFLTASDGYRYNSKIFHECNFLQANEGNIDPVHTSFLHRTFDAGDSTMSYVAGDMAPTLDVEQTDFGVRIYSVRKMAGERNYVRITNLVLPNLSAFPAGAPDGYTCNWHVAIDDAHHWKYVIQFRSKQPIDREAVFRERNPLGAGYRVDRNRENRYLQDREEMRTRTFAGLGTAFQGQDLCVTEGEGPIQNRAQEHLGQSDVAIVLARKVLLAAIDAVREGMDPPHVLRPPHGPEVPTLVARSDVLPVSVGWRRHWERAGLG